jgi:acyl carrier protein
VREQFAVAETDPHFSRHADLFELGYVDSVGVVELLVYIEQTFGFEVSEDEALTDDFASIEGLGRIVRRALAVGGARVEGDR